MLSVMYRITKDASGVILVCLNSLQELLAVPSPTQEVEISFSHARIENDPAAQGASYRQQVP